jgi:hypothetical protein
MKAGEVATLRRERNELADVLRRFVELAHDDPKYVAWLGLARAALAKVSA